jgi:chaperonin cofactor prefoldin
MKKSELLARIEFLEQRVTLLERENNGTTDALYEIETRLQQQLDALTNYTVINGGKINEK